MAKGLYKGFSSYEWQRRRSFRLTDVELVKMDIISHIFTRRGERVNMPWFGTTIPDLAFEPLDETTIDTLRSELETVIKFDPRVRLMSMRLIPDYDNNSIVARVELFYVELNRSNTMDLNIQFGG